MSNDFAAPVRKSALVVGHAGHELCVFGWMSQFHPQVHVLTDGSGRNNSGRTQSTARVLEAVQSEPGSLFSPLTDASIYQAMLEQDRALFLNLLEGLAVSLSESEIDLVVGDESEGFNPTHDLCRSLIDGAVALVKRRSGRTIMNYEVRLAGWEMGTPDSHDSNCVHFNLSDDLFQRKMAAADSYDELRADIRRAVTIRGVEHFKTECMRKSEGRCVYEMDRPHYERVGDQRVQDGVYPVTVRYREHILPLMTAINDYSRRA